MGEHHSIVGDKKIVSSTFIAAGVFRTFNPQLQVWFIFL